MPARLKHVDPRPPGLFSRMYAALANTRLGRFLSVNVVWRVNPYLMQATGGRLGLGLVMPTALLETRGAKSGAMAPCPSAAPEKLRVHRFAPPPMRR